MNAKDARETIKTSSHDPRVIDDLALLPAQSWGAVALATREKSCVTEVSTGNWKLTMQGTDVTRDEGILVDKVLK